MSEIGKNEISLRFLLHLGPPPHQPVPFGSALDEDFREANNPRPEQRLLLQENKFVATWPDWWHFVLVFATDATLEGGSRQLK